MDGTANAILMMAMFSERAKPAKRAEAIPNAKFTYDQGGITRGDRSSKRMALVLTGDEFAEGGDRAIAERSSRSMASKLRSS